MSSSVVLFILFPIVQKFISLLTHSCLPSLHPNTFNRSVTNKNGRRTDCFVACDGDGFSSSSGDFDDFSCNECRDINNRNRREDCLDDNNCR